MSEPVVSLESDRLQVEVGGQTSVKVMIKNLGKIVEGYRLEVLGEPAAWAEVLPADVSVFPGSEESATVVFTPPADDRPPGGSIPFAVKVQSTVDEENRIVVEGEIEIGQLFGLQAVLRPVTSHGRWRARHLLTVSNWGNTGAELRLTAHDPDEMLAFLIRPELLEVPLGGTATARIKIRTRHPQLRGTAVRRPFQVTCDPLGRSRTVGLPAAINQPERPVVDGAFDQRPILTRAAVLVTAMIVAAVVAGATWLVINRPSNADLLSPAGAPEVPKLQAVTDSSDRTSPILLRWSAVPDVSGYTIREVKENDNAIIPLQGSVNVGPKDTSMVAPTSAPGRHCFQIQAVRTGSPSSEWSAPVCAVGGPRTHGSASASPTGSPSSSSSSPPPDPGSDSASGPPAGNTSSPTPTSPTSGASAPTPSATPQSPPPPGSWVAAILIGPAGIVDVQAGTLATALNGQQHVTRFQVVDSSGYPGLAAQVVADSDFLISTPLPDQSSAQQVCTTIEPLLTRKNGAAAGIMCTAVQPGQPSP